MDSIHSTHSESPSTLGLSSVLPTKHRTGGGRRPMESSTGTLVLTRHYNEEIVIGDKNTLGVEPIRLCIMKGGTNQVRVVIKADKRIPVHRSEVYDRIEQASSDVEVLN